MSKILFGWLPFGINRLTQPFLRLILVFIQIAGIKEIFKKLNADALIVINGGYPAGETCRLANIVWYNTQKDEAKKEIFIIFIIFRSHLDLVLGGMKTLLIKNC